MPRMDDSLGTASFIAQNTDKYDEEYLVNLLEQPVEVTHESSRCHGPDADALQSGQFLMSELSASLVSSFQSIGVDSSLEAHEGEPMLISSVKQVVRPIAVRMGSRSVVLPPSTPLSERSGSASLEDGSSSVSSFTTLPSTISSPDSTKLANIMVSDEKSAFRTLHFSKNFSSVPLKTPLFYASLEDSSLVFNK